MIFITVGTQKFQFNRLIQRVDELVADGVITDDVFAQTGGCDYEPQHIEYKNFLDKDEFVKRSNEASIIIAHAGVGTIMESIKHKTPIIVCPRLVKYGEHVDDHQVEIAEAYESKGFIIACEDMENLSECITKAKSFVPREFVSHNDKMLKLIREFIANN